MYMCTYRYVEEKYSLVKRGVKYDMKLVKSGKRVSLVNYDEVLHLLLSSSAAVKFCKLTVSKIKYYY